MKKRIVKESSSQTNKTLVLVAFTVIIIIIALLSFKLFNGNMLGQATGVTCIDNDKYAGTNVQQSYVKSDASTTNLAGYPRLVLDTCFNSTRVYERVCNGNVGGTFPYDCPLGCLNGACRNNISLIQEGEYCILNNTNTTTCRFNNIIYSIQNLGSCGEYSTQIRITGSTTNLSRIIYLDEGAAEILFPEHLIIKNKEVACSPNLLILQFINPNLKQNPHKIKVDYSYLDQGVWGVQLMKSDLITGTSISEWSLLCRAKLNETCEIDGLRITPQAFGNDNFGMPFIRFSVNNPWSIDYFKGYGYKGELVYGAWLIKHNTLNYTYSPESLQFSYFIASLNQSACVPNCAGKQCGDNGCEGSCGTCNTDQTCSNGICVQNPITYLNSCTTISVPGTYVLNNDIISNSYICFNIVNNNVVLDGANKTIYLDGTGTAIFGYPQSRFLNNITIKNFNIRNASAAIYLFEAGNSSIFNNSIFDSVDYGITLVLSKSATIKNNYIYNSGHYNSSNNTYYGFAIGLLSSNGTIQSNMIYGSKSFGIFLDGSPNSNLLDNYVCGNAGSDFRCSQDRGINEPNFANNNRFSTNMGCGSWINTNQIFC